MSSWRPIHTVPPDRWVICAVDVGGVMKGEQAVFHSGSPPGTTFYTHWREPTDRDRAARRWRMCKWDG